MDRGRPDLHRCVSSVWVQQFMQLLRMQRRLWQEAIEFSQRPSAHGAINSRMFLYKVTHCYNNSNRYRLQNTKISSNCSHWKTKEIWNKNIFQKYDVLRQFWAVLVLDIAFRLSQIGSRHSFSYCNRLCICVQYYVRITAEVSQILVS